MYDWVQTCKSDEDKGLLQIMQLFLSSSGASYEIKPEKVAETSVSQMLLECIAEGFNKDKKLPFEEYPLSVKNTKPIWKKFRINFINFAQAFFEMGQDILLERRLILDKILELIFDMISSKNDQYVKCFFHTAILFGLKLNTTVIQVHCKLISEIEELKKGRYCDSRLIDHLKEKLDYLSNVNENLNRLISIGYIHEIEDIQCITMQELGLWMYQDSHMYLSDEYLKYFHRVMHDIDSPNARVEAMRGLIPLYELAGEDSVVEIQLESFTDKVFKKVIISACSESNSELNVTAHKIIQLLHSIGKDKFIVPYKDLLKIFVPNLVREKNIAYSSADYIYKRLRGADRNERKIIKSFIKLLIDAKVERNDQYMFLIADSLITTSKEFLDIDNMIDMLRTSNIANEEKVYICNLLFATIKVSTNQTGVSNRDAKLTKKGLREQSENREKFTNLILNKITTITDLFHSDIEKLKPLVKIVNLVDKQYIGRTSGKSSLIIIVKELMKIGSTHTDESLLFQIASALEFLSQENYPLGTVCKELVHSLFEDIIQETNANLSEYFEEHLSQKEIEKDFLPKLRRIKCFLKFIDFSRFQTLFDNLERLLYQSIDKEVSEVLIKEVLTGCTYFIQRSLNETLKDDRSHKNNLDDAHQFVLNFSLISIENDELAEAAFECICYILLSYKRGLKNVGCYKSLLSHTHSIIPNGASEMKTIGIKLQEFIEKFVFLQKGCLQRKERLEYLKLYLTVVMSSRLVMQYAHFIFLYWNKDDFYKPLMKQFFDWCRRTSRANLCRTIMYALGISFKNKKHEICDLIKLSKQLIINFGPKLDINRHAMRALHEEGIVFSIRHHSGRYIEFLRVVSEWSGKLYKEDRHLVKNFLDNQLKDAKPELFTDLNNSIIDEYKFSLGNRKRKVDIDYEALKGTIQKVSKKVRDESSSNEDQIRNPEQAEIIHNKITSTPHKLHLEDSILDTSHESPIVQRISTEKLKEMMRIKEILIQDTTDDEKESESRSIEEMSHTGSKERYSNEIHEIPDSIKSDRNTEEFDFDNSNTETDVFINTSVNSESSIAGSNFEVLDKHNIFLQNDDLERTINENKLNDSDIESSIMSEREGTFNLRSLDDFHLTDNSEDDKISNTSIDNSMMGLSEKVSQKNLDEVEEIISISDDGIDDIQEVEISSGDKMTGSSLQRSIAAQEIYKRAELESEDGEQSMDDSDYYKEAPCSIESANDSSGDESLNFDSWMDSEIKRFKTTTFNFEVSQQSSLEIKSEKKKEYINSQNSTGSNIGRARTAEDYIAACLSPVEGEDSSEETSTVDDILRRRLGRGLEALPIPHEFRKDSDSPQPKNLFTD
ncbi:DgyrCDS3636 [Dimorphilus gyrociliatus]|uniref:DgyrCDS3636 n=1 Tax=Dimorphilus gyrociliatus TaxID=2664684 RepID=A0A7I8VFV1_9ANNE|nr:DgyrCDS3636 [Dimorphilus gyrociliatus]